VTVLATDGSGSELAADFVTFFSEIGREDNAGESLVEGSIGEVFCRWTPFAVFDVAEISAFVDPPDGVLGVLSKAAALPPLRAAVDFELAAVVV
jgi:hypothetical protein